jgi:hypothetical protein
MKDMETAWRVLFVIIPILGMGAGGSTAGPASPPSAEIELEAGAAWQTRNDVAVPGDTGTRFALDDVTGSGPFAFARLNAAWNLAGRHGLRFVIAPLSFDGTGTLPYPVDFAGSTFEAGVPTDARYRFDSYRATYRYRVHDGGGWRWWIGGTLKVRDAAISLGQAGISAEKTNFGVVPLFHAAGEGEVGAHWRFVLDFDGLAAPQGRAFDIALKMVRDFESGWSVGAGYRTLEGGADNDEVYSFAWLHYALVSASYRF